MPSQSVIDIGENTISFNSQNIQGYVPNSTYLLKFEKASCKTRVFRARTNLCGCRVDFTFTINKCISDIGEWNLKVLIDAEDKADRTQLLKSTVQVYKS